VEISIEEDRPQGEHDRDRCRRPGQARVVIEEAFDSHREQEDLEAEERIR
jgi:hypothetical protein